MLSQKFFNLFEIGKNGPLTTKLRAFIFICKIFTDLLMIFVSFSITGEWNYNLLTSNKGIYKSYILHVHKLHFGI